MLHVLIFAGTGHNHLVTEEKYDCLKLFKLACLSGTKFKMLTADILGQTGAGEVD